MIYNKFPAIPKDILEALEERYPNMCPPENSSLEDFYRVQGQARVISFLQHQFKQQNLNILE